MPSSWPAAGSTATDRTRYIVILTDGYPDAAEERRRAGREARGRGSRSSRSASATPTVDYLRRLSSTEQARSSPAGRARRTFGHIARVIAEGGRSLRTLS